MTTLSRYESAAASAATSTSAASTASSSNQSTDEPVDLLGPLEERHVLILYATETGTALDVAEQIAREAHRRGFTVQLASTDAYPLEDLPTAPLVVFAVATAGAGQEPRSMAALWARLLRADLPPDLFDATRVAVFGLGDAGYEKFCWAAKMLSRRMEGLGATQLVARGEGDEQAEFGIDGALDEWMPRLFAALEEICPPLPVGEQLASADALPPPRIAILHRATLADDIPSHSADEPWACKEGYHRATVRRNDRLTAPGWFQDVRHIELAFADEIRYAPGDVAVIHPVAPADDVAAFLASVGWAGIADAVFEFAPVLDRLPVPVSIPRRTTLRALFTRHLDIGAVPRRSFFRLLRHFAQDEVEREKLEEFCIREGAIELYEYAHRVRRTIREVLEEFRSVRLPREYIFDLFPLLRPREFSIASAVSVYPRQVHLCVAIVRYKTKLKLPRRGVCTTYMASWRPGDVLSVGLRRGYLSLPKDPSIPVVCIGPGTGIAPMRALLGERIHAGSTANTLYFGCRSTSKDYYYADEWAAHERAGALALRVAFSRDGPAGVGRTYVQDLMARDGERLWRLVGGEGAWVYISGSSNKMPAAVKGAIVAAARSVGGLSEGEARDYVKAMQLGGRLFEECWS